jgi:hypothetical protein
MTCDFCNMSGHVSVKCPTFVLVRRDGHWPPDQDVRHPSPATCPTTVAELEKMLTQERAAMRAAEIVVVWHRGVISGLEVMKEHKLLLP